MNLSLSEARNIFTKRIAAKYKEGTRHTKFFHQFFSPDEGTEKHVSIEVERGIESIAVDVVKGTESNRNTFSFKSEKTYDPPMYDEDFPIEELRFYDNISGRNTNGTINPETFSEYVESIATKVLKLEDKIIGAYELQCSQVMFDGIVQLKNNDNVDFKRKAQSLVDDSGNTWAIDTNDPTTVFLTGANFIRKEGKYKGGVFNAVVSDDAYQALVKNKLFQDRANLRNVSLADISMPVGMPEGAVIHGEISVGSYRVILWGYPQFYTTQSGVITPFVPAKKFVMFPTTPVYTLAYAGVPMIMQSPENSMFPEYVGMQKGAFHLDNFVDRKNYSHRFRVRSAGIAIPTAIDTIFTAQVLV